MPSLRQLLFSDLQRQLELEGRKDAQATFTKMLSRILHPRFLPVILCRVSRSAMLSHIPFVPQILTYLNIVLFGIEISPRCDIGPGVFFPHTSGTVIGARRMGRNVTVFQGATLGAKGLDMSFSGHLRPEVGDEVTLGAGCKVLGGIRIGERVTVGANSVVLESIVANMTVVGVPARTVTSKRQGER